MNYGLGLDYSLSTKDGNPLDKKYGPYASVANALAALPSGVRGQGLTVGVMESGAVVEYQFKNGIADGDLVAKAVVASLSSWKSYVVLATVAALPTNSASGDYQTLTASANGAFPSIDDEASALGMRVLVKNETDQKKNGIYKITTVGTGSLPYVLTRDEDANTGTGLQGATVLVERGTVNTGKIFRQTSVSVTIGTTSIVWQEIGGSAAWNDIINKPNRVLSPKQYIHNVWDFENGTSGTPFSTNAANSGSVVADTPQTGMEGMIKLEIGLSASSIGGINTSSLFSKVGTGEMVFETLIKFSNLSDGTNTYYARIGIINAFGLTLQSGIEVTHGVYFEYSSASSANWRICTGTSTTFTKTNTSTAVNTNNTTLKIVINAAGTSAEFFVDGSSVGTQTGNFPTNQQVGINAYIYRTAGSTGFRQLYIDYISYEKALTTSR